MSAVGAVPDGEARSLLLAACVVDLGEGRVRSRQGGSVGLSGREVGLLALLAARTPEPVTKEVLLRQCDDNPRALEASIRRLRSKLERDPRAPEHLLTSFGIGYRLVGVQPSERVGTVRIAGPRGAVHGRVADLAQLRALIERRWSVDARAIGRRRCLQLTGPPGVGKTTLARALLAGAAGVFVDLAEADGVISGVAAALGVPPPGLEAHLAVAPEAWIVLDNAEFFPDDVDVAVRGWLSRGNARFLVTSRSVVTGPDGPLGEVRPVGPLDPEAAATLLRERVEDHRPGLSRDPTAQRPMAALLASLDGLPLAIELAARRLAALPLSRVVEPQPRRRSDLEATLEASWALLGAGARDALTRLALFRGRFDGADVQAVLGEDGAAHVETLRRSSLIQPTDAGLRLLIPIRDFALRRLEGDASHADAARRYVAHVAASGEDRPADRRFALSLACRLPIPEHVAALTRAVDRAMAIAMGPPPERAALLRAGLAVPGLLPADRVALRISLARVLKGDAGLAEADEALQEALDAGDPRGAGDAMATRGALCLYRGDLDGALDALSRPREGAPLDYWSEEARAEALHRTGRAREARQHLLSLLTSVRADGADGHERYLLLRLADTEQALGQYAAADRTRGAAGDLPDHGRLERFNRLCARGRRACEAGHLDEAHHHYTGALALALGWGNPGVVGHTEGNLAVVDELRGDTARALARLVRVEAALGASDDPVYEAQTLAFRARLLLADDLDAADALLASAHQGIAAPRVTLVSPGARWPRDVVIGALVSGLWAEVAARRGDAPAAAARLQAARAVLQGTDLVDNERRLQVQEGLVAWFLGDRAEAVRIGEALAATPGLDHVASTRARVRYLLTTMGRPGVGPPLSPRSTATCPATGSSSSGGS